MESACFASGSVSFEAAGEAASGHCRGWALKRLATFGDLVASIIITSFNPPTPPNIKYSPIHYHILHRIVFNVRGNIRTGH